MLPSEVAYMKLYYIFTTPSLLKMHDWLVIVGPIMKYLLQGEGYLVLLRCLAGSQGCEGGCL